MSTDVATLPLANQLAAKIEEMNRNYAVIFVGSSLRILWEQADPATGHVTPVFISPADFRTLLKNQHVPGDPTISLAEFFLSHPKRREYKSIDFVPGTTPPGVYNLWTGFSIAPKPGDTMKFWALVSEGMCAGNGRLYKFVRKWLAHLVQKPDELPGTALVLRGKQGTGKGTFVDAVGKLVGPHYLPVNSLEQISGRFNSHLASMLLVYANEAVWGGNRPNEGALKAMVTDPRLPYEAKGKDITSVQNFKRLIVSSNEEWAVPRGLDDRRFCVLDVSDKFKEDQVFFAELRKELDNGGYAALMHDLQQEDITEFNPRVMPVTGAGLDMKLRSTTSTIRWLHEFLKDGYQATRLGSFRGDFELPREGGEAEKDKVYELYMEFCAIAERGKPEPKSQFWKALRAMGLNLREARPAQGTAKGERKRVVAFPALEEARKAFEALVRQPVEWEE